MKEGILEGLLVTEKGLPLLGEGGVKFYFGRRTLTLYGNAVADDDRCPLGHARELQDGS